MIVTARRNWLLVGSASLGLALGCGGDGGEAPAPPAAGGPPAAEAPAAPKAGAPKAAPQAARPVLPDNFPSDVPVEAGARVSEVRVADGGDLSLLLEVDSGFADAAGYYADGLAAEGWSTEIQDTPDGRIILADKGSRSAIVTVRSGEAGTLVEMIVVEMK